MDMTGRGGGTGAINDGIRDLHKVSSIPIIKLQGSLVSVKKSTGQGSVLS